MTHFLQEKLKPKHLRLLDFGGQLKKLKQRPGQSVSELVSYLETLEDQLPKRPSESQKHSNLLHSLHDYLQRAIIRANLQGKNRVELIEAARVAERVEPKPDFLRTTSTRTQSRCENGERSSRPSYARRSSTYMRTTSSKPDEPKNANTTQAVVTRPNSKRPREETYDNFGITCWNCNKKGHKRSECRAPSRRSGKA